MSSNSIPGAPGGLKVHISITGAKASGKSHLSQALKDFFYEDYPNASPLDVVIEENYPPEAKNSLRTARTFSMPPHTRDSWEGKDKYKDPMDKDWRAELRESITERTLGESAVRPPTGGSAVSKPIDPVEDTRKMLIGSALFILQRAHAAVDTTPMSKSLISQAMQLISEARGEG